MTDREPFTFPVWHHMGRTCLNGTCGRWRGPNCFFRFILAFQLELAAYAKTEFIKCVVSYAVKQMYGTNPAVCLGYLLQFCEISPSFTVVWETHMPSQEGVDAPSGKIQEHVQSGAISVVPTEDTETLHFMVPKNTGNIALNASSLACTWHS